jgi:hypothetical protein
VIAFDIDAELAALSRRRAIAEVSLFDFASERLLLGAVLANDAIEDRPPFMPHHVPILVLVPVNGRMVDVGLCADLETDDFADYRHQLVFKSIRNAIAKTDQLPDLVDVDDEIVRYLATRDVGPHHRAVDLLWLFDLVTTTSRVTVTWITAALGRLRGLANHRRMA